LTFLFGLLGLQQQQYNKQSAKEQQQQNEQQHTTLSAHIELQQGHVTMIITAIVMNATLAPKL
jgi:hypothetical protein